MTINLTSSPISPTRKTILTTDLDGTLLIGAKDNMKRNAEDRFYDTSLVSDVASSINNSGVSDVFINTGRNFSELKEVKSILQDSQLPFTAIALEDGKRLLTKPNDVSSQEWMEDLFDDNKNYLRFSDKNWTAKNSVATQTIRNYLEKELGFIHRKDDGETIIYSKPVSTDDIGVSAINSKAHWEVALPPASAGFNLTLRNSTEADTIDVEKYNSFLAEKIDELLENQNIDVEDSKTKKEVRYINTFERNDINKGTVADYVRESQGSSTLEIRAGNDMNDKSMLVNTNPKVFSIQVGTNSVLSQYLANQQNTIQVGENNLATGIKQAAKKLDLCA